MLMGLLLPNKLIGCGGEELLTDQMTENREGMHEDHKGE